MTPGGILNFVAGDGISTWRVEYNTEFATVNFTQLLPADIQALNIIYHLLRESQTPEEAEWLSLTFLLLFLIT